VMLRGVKNNWPFFTPVNNLRKEYERAKNS
jgi:hypothetical protein